MIYLLFEYLQKHIDFPGIGLFKYISFRAGLSIIFSLLISTIFGKKIIKYLKNKQIGETVRDLGLQGQHQKKGTPTMGGIIIIISVIVPVLLFTDLTNIYILILLLTTLWMGSIGIIDDYIKVFGKNKKGLAGKFKIVGQISLGIIVGLSLYFHPDVTIKENLGIEDVTYIKEISPRKMYTTTVPFFKNNELDYSSILKSISPNLENYTWIVFILMVTLIITAVSNGSNLTDGIDGLAAGSSAIIGVALMIFAWVSGNIIYSDYLNIMYIPLSGEIVIFAAAFIGALIGFLWYNAFPAQIFMGDTGSLTVGGVIAVISIAIRKELLIPLLCGIFVIENLSVILQVSYFKYTKKKYGVGRRLFKMSPLHHHFQKLGFHESKIVLRFWIIGIILAILTIITLKIR